MRRVEALVGPDALEHINAERHLLQAVVEALGGGDPKQAPERARRAVERVKQLESELGKIRQGDRTDLARSLADAAVPVDGVWLVVHELSGQDADGLREMAIALRGLLDGRGGGAAVLGNADRDRALLVASVTPSLVQRVRAPELLAPAASAIGGGAGGKDILAFAGGRNAAALQDALGSIPARLEELLRQG
jgi:alanyl-tRNA synthetase